MTNKDISIYAAVVIEIPLYNIDPNFKNRVFVTMFDSLEKYGNAKATFKSLRSSRATKSNFKSDLTWSYTYSSNVRPELSSHVTLGARINSSRRSKLELKLSPHQ